MEGTKGRRAGGTKEGGREGQAERQSSPMALNQLAPAPGSLGGIREALKGTGNWRT